MTFEEVLKEYEIDTPEYLKEVLEDHIEACQLTITTAAFLSKKGLLHEFRVFVQKHGKENEARKNYY